MDRRELREKCLAPKICVSKWLRSEKTILEMALGKSTMAHIKLKMTPIQMDVKELNRTDSKVSEN